MVSATKAVSAAILMSTSTELTRALSVVPMMSSQVTKPTTITAGTLTQPPTAIAVCRSTFGVAPKAICICAISASALLIDAGKATPRPRSSPTAWFDQPTATALAPTAYSRINAQPTIQARISPTTA